MYKIVYSGIIFFFLYIWYGCLWLIDLVGLKAVPEPKNKGKIEDSTKEIFFGERL